MQERSCVRFQRNRIIYFGDTARVPYGSKSKETIIRFSRQIIRFLQSKGVKAIVIACNTASALALETVQPEFDIPILGVVKAGAKEAAESHEKWKNRCDCHRKYNRESVVYKRNSFT